MSDKSALSDDLAVFLVLCFHGCDADVFNLAVLNRRLSDDTSGKRACSKRSRILFTGIKQPIQHTLNAYILADQYLEHRIKNLAQDCRQAADCSAYQRFIYISFNSGIVYRSVLQLDIFDNNGVIRERR